MSGEDQTNPGSGEQTAEQTKANEAAIAAAAEQAKTETLAKFGIKPAAPASGDPEKKSDDAQLSPGDPDKATTAKDGSGKDGEGDKKAPASEKIFGKYDSMDSAEVGYNNLVTHKVTIEKENADLRKQLAKLQKQGEDSPNLDASKGTTPRDRYLANPKFKAAYEADVTALGEQAANARLERDIELWNQTESRDNEARSALDELSRERLERELVDQYPELKTGSESRKDFDKLLKAFEGEPNESLVLSTLAKAALFERIPALMDEVVRKTREAVLKEIKTKGIASTLTADSALAGPTDQGQTLDEKKAYVLAKFGIKKT